MASKRDIIWAFAGLCCMNLIASLDTTTLSVCIPTIAIDLDATSIQAYWSGTAFILASAVLQPVISALSCAFGRIAMIQFSLVVFAIGTIVCATAQHVAPLLVGRTLQGVGGGGMLTMTYVVMTDLLDLRGRAKGIAVLSVVWLIGTCTGPIMGGGFTTHVTWRWIFWICLPLVGIGLVLNTFCLNTPYKATYMSQGLANVDWVGAAIFVASLTSFLIAISWGGTQFAWSSYATLVPLLIGIVGIICWLLYEHRIPATPMLPLAIFKDRTAVLAFLSTVLMGLVQFSLLYFLPLYYEASKDYTPLIAGVALLPNCIGSALSTIALSPYIAKSGHYKIVATTGWALLALGCGILVLLDSNTSVPAWIFMNVVSGLGLGCLFASLSIASQAPQSEENMAIAAGVTPFFRAIGQAFGIAISDAIYQNTLKHYLLESSDPHLQTKADSLAKNSASIVLILRLLPHGSVHRVKLLHAFNESLHAVWWAIAGISIFAGILSLLMKEFSLDTPTSTSSEGAMMAMEDGTRSERDQPYHY